ncbi:condensation domain-containing protein, partial [Mesorhizobium mediterraneum]|uniref:condensation domain-containing protein n=1 Tax=Mesorhizobium mediterraneum TaxID=43617 RepID=UPI001AEEAF1D
MNSAVEGFPLAPQQKRVWLSQQQDGFPYLCEATIRIEGELDRVALRRALDRVIASHEILRTRFCRVPGLEFPLQVISADGTTEFGGEISGLPDFENGPLLRFGLGEGADGAYVLSVRASALQADARSMHNLARAIAAAYQAIVAGGDLDTDPVQYVQFSEWQNEILAADESVDGKRFWTQQADVAPEITLPFEADAAGASKIGRMPGPFLNMPAGGVAPRAALLACWTAQLSRRAGQKLVAVRVRTDGRPYAEMHDGLGLYERWPLLRSTIEGEMTFAELAQGVDAALGELDSWQEYYSGEG